MKNRFSALLIGYTILLAPDLYAQDTLKNQMMTLPQAFKLALKNSVQLSISKTETNLAQQQVEITKLEQLPGISTGLDYGYISNADIWTPSFSEHETGIIPHHLTEFTTEAAEEIFKGGEVRNNIKKATLEEQITILALEKNTEDIKFLVASQYLDIYRFINLRQVYANNVRLAKNQLKNILIMERQGMVTENDVLRTKLTLSDLELSIRKTNNNIAILNNQMNVILGLPADAKLIPDSTILNTNTSSNNVESFVDTAFKENHELKISATKVKIAETNLKLLGSDRYPSFSLFAGNSLQRPFLYNIPVIDVYYNIWQAGISVHYNISSIYQSPRKIKAGKIQLDESRQSDVLEKQNQEVDVRVHQLALLTDLIDATNTKIDAETKVTNAEINKVYAYFLLLKASSGSIGI